MRHYLNTDVDGALDVCESVCVCVWGFVDYVYRKQPKEYDRRRWNVDMVTSLMEALVIMFKKLPIKVLG